MSLLRNIASEFRSLFRKEQVSKELARISQTKIEKGCRFWHNSFCPKEIVPEEATALWLQSVSRKACTSPPQEPARFEPSSMSTLNRLELTPATASAKARRKKIVADHAAVDRLFVSIRYRDAGLFFDVMPIFDETCGART